MSSVSYYPNFGGHCLSSEREENGFGPTLIYSANPWGRQIIRQTTATSNLWESRALIPLIGLLCLVAYLPTVNNGFIADDYVLLDRVGILKHNPGYLFLIPPEIFRAMSDVAFVLLKSSFGYRSEWFYAFSIALHFVNCLLLRAILREFPRTAPAAGIAAICFAVFQAPQEAVMWVAAVGEEFQILFVLATLVLWMRKRYFPSMVCYALALLSKESAVVVLPLIPIAEYLKGERISVRRYLLPLIPTGAFIAMFLWTWSRNYMISSSNYAIGPHALLVLMNSLFRLTWPWLLILIALAILDRAQWLSLRWLAVVVVLLAIPVMPYMFITYQNHILSRQTYMASAVFMAICAYMIRQLHRPSLRNAFLIVFVAFNIWYLWFKKDPQFESRAAPTTQLALEMRKRKPGQLFIRNFEYFRSPEIAYFTAATVPGWSPDLIGIENWNSKDPGCTVLRWDEKLRRYIEEK